MTDLYSVYRHCIMYNALLSITSRWCAWVVGVVPNVLNDHDLVDVCGMKKERCNMRGWWAWDEFVMDVVWVRDEKVVVWDGRDGIAGWMWRGRGTGVEWAWDLSVVGVGWSWDVCTMAKMGVRWEWSERGVEVGWKSVLLNVEWTVFIKRL